MKIREIINEINTYSASVRLKNGHLIKTTVKASSQSDALQLFKHLYLNVSSVSELREQGADLDEQTATKTPQQLQVQSLADQAARLKKQKDLMVARQSMQKSQEKMRLASSKCLNQ